MKALALSLALLGGCATTTEPVVELPEPPAPLLTACTSDAACSTGNHCFDNVCIAGDPTTTSGAIVAQYLGLDRDVGDCSKAYPMAAYKPQGPGPFPVFVFLNGTMDPGIVDTAWDNKILHDTLLKPMAARGFYAVLPAYPRDTRIVGDAGRIEDHEIEPYYTDKARCMFEQTSDPAALTYGSLVSTLDRLPEVDAGMGLALAGQSQGGVIALIAHGVNPNVAAVLGIGVGNSSDRGRCTGVSGDFSALNDGVRALPSSRVRIVNGQSDDVFAEGTSCEVGGRGLQPREQLNEILGRSCDVSQFECLATDGSGWVVVHDEYVVDGVANHAYWVDGQNVDLNWRDDVGLGAGGTWTRRAGQDWMRDTLFASGPPMAVRW